MSTATKHGDRIQPGDLAAYRGLLYAIAAEAVESSQKPMGEWHRDVKKQVVELLKTMTDKQAEIASGERRAS